MNSITSDSNAQEPHDKTIAKSGGQYVDPKK